MATGGQNSKTKKRTRTSSSPLQKLQMQIFVKAGCMHFMMGAVRNVECSLLSANVESFFPYMNNAQKFAFANLLEATKRAQCHFQADAIENLRHGMYEDSKQKLLTPDIVLWDDSE